MHVLIPFAAPLSAAGRQSVEALRLPNLASLFAQAAEPSIDAGDALSFSPPHERALAREFGWAGADGCLPFAAHLAAADGRDTGALDWGLLTPSHWHVGSDQVALTDPQALELDEASSRSLLDAVKDLFESEGFVLVYGAPLRWYLAHESLAGRRSASPDRVIGRNVDAWMTPGADARLLRRLQSEAQMRWYGHGLNDEREARGLPVVNSFWLSGCGRRQPAAPAADLRIDERLRRPALAEDWTAWAAAWQALD
ncbi:MAG: hypothetical protein Q8N44_09485, partial [Rubrivivax sp.]|nr:hypothetical protein [Rubrivivax sp.]